MMNGGLKSFKKISI